MDWERHRRGRDDRQTVDGPSRTRTAPHQPVLHPDDDSEHGERPSVDLSRGERAEQLFGHSMCVGDELDWEAFRVIQRGDALAMFAGGAEAPITPLSFAGFCANKALSTNPDPETACRPFDENRDGFIMGEGAGVLVLEEYEHAKARGAKIYAEVVGYGMSSDAYHITAPSPEAEGGSKAMSEALRDAGIRPEDVQYINAHGTSTPLNDMLETKAIRNVFGEHADNLAVNSSKSMIGHLLGAAGGVEAVITALSIHEGKIHPTINCASPAPDCDLDYVRDGNRELDIQYALSNSLGFGGHNATLAFAKVTD